MTSHCNSNVDHSKGRVGSEKYGGGGEGERGRERDGGREGKI